MGFQSVFSKYIQIIIRNAFILLSPTTLYYIAVLISAYCQGKYLDQETLYLVLSSVKCQWKIQNFLIWAQIFAHLKKSKKLEKGRFTIDCKNNMTSSQSSAFITNYSFCLENKQIQSSFSFVF